MNDLFIEPGIKTPYINFSANGLLEMKGKSIPENSVEFYRPVFEWLDTYISRGNNKTSLRIALEYFNTSSSKCLLDLLRKLETLQKGKKVEVSVTWCYEENDEDMMEAGNDYKEIVNLPFIFETIS
jgi:hypothetical protein